MEGCFGSFDRLRMSGAGGCGARSFVGRRDLKAGVVNRLLRMTQSF